jgi:hypothetical protein
LARDSERIATGFEGWHWLAALALRLVKIGLKSAQQALDAFVVVGDPTPACDELRQLIEPKVLEERSYAGFNPARREDLQLF